MSPRATITFALGLVLASLAAPARARAEAAPADTAFHGFLHTLADSTDRYFGMSAQPLDTTGLDEENAGEEQGARRIRFSFIPLFDFSRVDGSTFGASARIRGPRGLGELDLGAAYAVGAERLLGSGALRFARLRPTRRSSLEIRGGRALAGMNRDYRERVLDPARALATGSDRAHYLRHDGWGASVEHGNRADTWRAGLGFRDELESPLATESAWDLFHRKLVVKPNLAATFGRVREVTLAGGARLPLVPLSLEGTWSSAGPGIGSDLAYDRVRIAAGGEFPLGRFASLLPQAAWGVLHGDRPPQESFFLGAGPTLVSVPRDALGGASFAIAKLDLVQAGDLLRLLHLPHPAALVLQGGLFAATAAVGGADPYGGPARPGDDFPDRREWRSEAGASLRYDPGVFGAALVLKEAWPLGPTRRGERFEFMVSHPLDLMRRPRSED
jgi:hypothetical protein